ncbi:MAG: hypothetical protein Q9225_000284 [Loekoesia sp. 1 TL-2023]
MIPFSYQLFDSPVTVTVRDHSNLKRIPVSRYLDRLPERAYATPPASPASRVPVSGPLLGAFVLGRMSGMEDNGHQRRGYEHQQYPRGFAPNYRQNVPEGNAPERLGQAQMMMGRSPTTASAGSATGAHPHELGGFGYPQSAQYSPAQMQSSSLQFPPDYSQDQQRSQNFPQYTSQMVYNVPQQPQHRSSYEPVPQYHPRQSASLEVMSNQFGVPSYYHSGEPIGPSGHTSPDQQYASSEFHQNISYQTPGGSRQTIPTSYPTGMAEYPHSSAQEVAEQPEPESSAQDEGYDQYQEALRQVFENTSKGRLIEAAHSLLETSEWLLGHVKELGTIFDNRPLREERLKLWREFNICWLAVLQRQKDNTQQMIDTGQPPSPPQSILQGSFLERMAEALVRLCDGVEKYGLVDYQMGVWEEEIMSSEAYGLRMEILALTNDSVLTQCLDLLEGGEAHAPEGGNIGPQTQEGPST